MEQDPRGERPNVAGWRLELGAALLLLSVVVPVAGVPLIASLGLSTAATATASGIALVSGEALGIVAVATMGKPGFAYLKGRIGAFIRRHEPPHAVSRGRYRVGLILIFVPLAFGWLSPYIAAARSELPVGHLALAVGGDLVLVVGLFVAGGDFWDKIRGLFLYEARAALP